MSGTTTVITIKKNDFVFDRTKYYNNLELLKNDISGFTKVVEVNIENLMELIIDEIELTPELIGSSPICHQTSTNVYQLCFAGEREQNLGQTQATGNENKVANYLVHDTILSNCVFLNSKISDTKTCVNDNADMDTFVKILYSKFIHTGIKILANDSKNVTEFVYGDHPLEHYQITTYDENKYKILEFDFISLALCVVIDQEEQVSENKKVNKIMTRLIGNQVIYGDVLVILKIPNAYEDLNMELYQKINILSFGLFDTRTLTEDEKKDTEKLNELQVVNNKHCMIESRLKMENTFNYYTNCANKKCTKSDMSKLSLCKGCFRVKYHDKECQAADWENHKCECFF